MREDEETVSDFRSVTIIVTFYNSSRGTRAYPDRAIGLTTTMTKSRGINR